MAGEGHEKHDPEPLTSDVGGDSISRDEFMFANIKALYDQTIQHLSAEIAQTKTELAQANSQAQSFFSASMAQALQHQADLNAQQLQNQAVLNANTQQAQRNAIERENLALSNSTHAIALAQQAGTDHARLAFDSALPNANVGTAAEARGAGRILAGEPEDVVDEDGNVPPKGGLRAEVQVK